jgi:hypothetical protein
MIMMTVSMLMGIADQMTDSVYLRPNRLGIFVQICQRIQHHVTADTIFTV